MELSCELSLHESKCRNTWELGLLYPMCLSLGLFAKIVPIGLLVLNVMEQIRIINKQLTKPNGLNELEYHEILGRSQNDGTWTRCHPRVFPKR